MASGFLSYLLRPLLFQDYKNILLQLTVSISKFKSLIHLKFIWCKVQTRDLTFFPDDYTVISGLTTEKSFSYGLKCHLCCILNHCASLGLI